MCKVAFYNYKMISVTVTQNKLASCRFKVLH